MNETEGKSQGRGTLETRKGMMNEELPMKEHMESLQQVFRSFWNYCKERYVLPEHFRQAATRGLNDYGDKEEFGLTTVLLADISSSWELKEMVATLVSVFGYVSEVF